MSFLFTLIGSIISLPYIVSFWFAWIVSCTIQPFVVLSILFGITFHPKATVYKFQLFINATKYLFFCNDKKFPKKKPPPKQQQQQQQFNRDDDDDDDVVATTTTVARPTTTTTTEVVVATTNKATTTTETNNRIMKKEVNNQKAEEEEGTSIIIPEVDEKEVKKKETIPATATETTNEGGTIQEDENNNNNKSSSCSNNNNKPNDTALSQQMSSSTEQQQQPKEENCQNRTVTATTTTTKTIIFVRHGESTWNDTFNKGDRKLIHFILWFIPNLMYAMYMEWYFYITGEMIESWFYDSPLSMKGIHQAKLIQQFLSSNPHHLLPKEAKLVSILQGGDINTTTATTNNKYNNKDTSNSIGGNCCCSSQLVSSNLRRAVATLAVGFHDRLKQQYTNDKIMILPSLQEISRNPDALSITPPYEPIHPAWTDPYELQAIYNQQFLNTSYHNGNKVINGNGLQRIQEFVHFIFHNNEIIQSNKSTIIATGHSLWFREFFKFYLPTNYDHIAKKKKIINGGIVAFTFEQTEIKKMDTTTTTSTATKHHQHPEYQYRIIPGSIVILHGGF